jgi:hypothetical protein
MLYITPHVHFYERGRLLGAAGSLTAVMTLHTPLSSRHAMLIETSTAELQTDAKEDCARSRRS